jgi:hypothetical protein
MIGKRKNLPKKIAIGIIGKSCACKMSGLNLKMEIKTVVRYLGFRKIGKFKILFNLTEPDKAFILMILQK